MLNRVGCSLKYSDPFPSGQAAQLSVCLLSGESVARSSELSVCHCTDTVVWSPTD